MRLCISGTPATGKTTIAKLLAKKLKWKLIELNKLAEDKNLYCGYDRKRNVKIVDIEKVKKDVEGLKEKNLIIESHYAHYMPCNLVIILRVNPAEMRKRGEEKGWKKEKMEENLEAEIMEICKQEAFELGRKILEIDTTGKKYENIVKEIINKLKL